MIITKKLGTLYFDRRPVDIGTPYKGQQVLSIGNTVPGKEITMVEVNGQLIADRLLCTKISAIDLEEQGFSFGKEVLIDGRRYLCRLLKVGVRRGAPNEWDAALDATSDDNELWHWKEGFFWGQEGDVQIQIPCGRAVRGCHSARFWDSSSATGRNVGVGFRPTLIPLDDDTSTSGKEDTPPSATMDIRMHTCPKCGKTWFEDCDADDYPNYCPSCGGELPLGHTGTFQAKASAPIKPISGLKRLWMRAGVSLMLTDKEVDAILGKQDDDGLAAQNVLKAALMEGRFKFDGNSYIPQDTIEEFNREHGTAYDAEEPEFEL